MLDNCHGVADDIITVLLDSPMSREEKDIYVVVSGVSSLIDGRRYNMLSFVMASVDPGAISTEFALALLRVSFPVRDRINSWRLFLSRTSDAIRATGRDDVKILIGLFDDIETPPASGKGRDGEG